MCIRKYFCKLVLSLLRVCTPGAFIHSSHRYTLSTGNVAIASLLCAFFPVFPVTSLDNRYHLQAMRHLYVLAAQPGVLIARGQDTGHAHPVEVAVKTTDGRLRVSTTPCLVQSWDEIESVEVVDQKYWPFTVGPATVEEGGCNPLRLVRCVWKGCLWV